MMSMLLPASGWLVPVSAATDCAQAQCLPGTLPAQQLHISVSGWQ